MFQRILALLLLATATVLAAEVKLDRVVFRESGVRDCWVVSEGLEETKWRSAPDSGSETSSRRSKIRSVTYAFQLQPSAWTQGMEARERGKFDESADLFHQLAAKGTREAEKVVGGFEEGASLELAGKFGEAAKAFQAVLAGFPNHPWNLDAQYRLGLVLAQNKQAAEAEAVAKKLDELSKGTIGQPAVVRAAAIRAALAQANGDPKEFRRFSLSATFNPEMEHASWLHFNLYTADGWRLLNQPKEAAPIYERMLKNLGDDPSNTARVRLGLALCRIDGDRQGAILELLALDALPYGSPEQKSEARFQAGRLILAEAQAAEKDPAVAKDPPRAAFLLENFRTARFLLESAVQTTTEKPTKAQTDAKALLDTLPAEKAAEATGDKPAEAAAAPAGGAAAPAAPAVAPAAAPAAPAPAASPKSK